jgi:cytochrome c oxidase subunit III
VLAHQAAQAGDGPKAWKYLWGTFAGGATFVGVKSFEWTHEIHEGFTITTNAFWSFYYTAAGLHACHVIGGMLIMAIISNDVKNNRELQRVELIGNYWHFVDIVWIFLFPLLYIAK